MFVIIIDFFVVMTVLIFVSCLSRKQNQFIKAFKEQTLYMEDFAIKIKNLPFDYQFDNKEDILKARLWDHLENVLNQSEENEKERNSKSGIIRHEIIDITFGKQKF